MESSPYRRATRGRPSALRPASRSSSLIAPFRSVKKRTEAGSRGRPIVAPVVCTVRANVLQVRASSGSLRTLSWMIRATASRSSGRVGAATSRPAIRRTSPPAVSQAHLPASLATPEPTAPRTAVMAAIDMGSSIAVRPLFPPVRPVHPSRAPPRPVARINGIRWTCALTGCQENGAAVRCLPGTVLDAGAGTNEAHRRSTRE